MDKTPTCPYCGGWMKINADGEGLSWLYCVECNALSPEGETKEDALEKALRRASPWHSVKDGLPDSGTVCVLHERSWYGADWYDIARKTRDGWEFYGMHRFEVEHWMAVPDAPKEGEHNEDT